MPRKHYSPAFKLEVALASIREEGSLSELSARFGVPQVNIHKWRQIVLDRGGLLFDSSSCGSEIAKLRKELDTAHSKIGKVVIERDFLRDVHKSYRGKVVKKW